MARKRAIHTDLRPRAATALKRWQHLRSDSLGSDAPGEVTTISTARFALFVVAVATVFTLYIGHVYQTQDILNALQQSQGENLRLHLRYNELKGEFDESTGPSVIHQRAPGLGLEDGFSNAPLVRAN